MPDEPVITAKLLARCLGVEVPALADVPKKWIGRPDKDGNYPQKVLEGAFSYLRWQRDKCTRNDLAEMLAVAPQRVDTMGREGVFEQDEHAEYDRREAMLAVGKWYRERLGSSNSDMGALKRQKLERENQLLAIQLANASRDSLPVRAFEQAWEPVLLTMRQKLLRIGNKVAPRIPYLKSESEIENAVTAEVEEALGELSRPVDYAEKQDGEAA